MIFTFLPLFIAISISFFAKNPVIVKKELKSFLFSFTKLINKLLSSKRSFFDDTILKKNRPLKSNIFKIETSKNEYYINYKIHTYLKIL